MGQAWASGVPAILLRDSHFAILFICIINLGRGRSQSYWQRIAHPLVRGGITIAAHFQAICRCATPGNTRKGDCNASCHKGTFGYGVNLGVLRWRVRTGCRRRRWYGRRRGHRGRQRRWPGHSADRNPKWQRHHRFDTRDVGFEHNGKVLRRRASTNEYGDHGRACLGQRSKEALLTVRLGRLGRPLSRTTLTRTPGA